MPKSLAQIEKLVRRVEKQADKDATKFQKDLESLNKKVEKAVAEAQAAKDAKKVPGPPGPKGAPGDQGPPGLDGLDGSTDSPSEIMDKIGDLIPDPTDNLFFTDLQDTPKMLEGASFLWVKPDGNIVERSMLDTKKMLGVGEGQQTVVAGGGGGAGGLWQTSAGITSLITASTGAVLTPSGTTGQRPGAPVNGLIRYNDTLNEMEAYINGAWTDLAAGDNLGNHTATTTLEMGSNWIEFDDNFGIRPSASGGTEKWIEFIDGAGEDYLEITQTPGEYQMDLTGSSGQIDLNLTAPGADSEFLFNINLRGQAGYDANFSSNDAVIMRLGTGITTSRDAEIAMDDTVTDWSHGMYKGYGGEETFFLTMPIAEISTMADGYVPSYDATNDELTWQDPSALAGSTDGPVGSIQFAGVGNIHDSDAELVWDDTEKSLEVGGAGTTVGTALQVTRDYTAGSALQDRTAFIIADWQVADTGFKQALRTTANATHTSGTLGQIAANSFNLVLSGSGGTTTSAYGSYHGVTVGAGHTVTDLYQSYLPTITNSGTVTNQWGYYQEDPNALNAFLGHTGIGIGGDDTAWLHVVGLLSDGAQDQYGVNVAPLFNTSRTFTAYGWRSRPTATHTTGTITELVAGQTDARINNAGDVTDMYSGRFSVTNIGTGTVTNAYALHIPAFTETGPITNKWGVYQEDDGTNYLEGDTGIGTNAPSAKLGVNDAYTVANASQDVITRITGDWSAADSGNKIGLRLNISASNTSGTLDDLFGVSSVMRQNGASGTTTDSFAYYTRTEALNATGTITNAYGLYIDSAIETGTITNKWGIYQVDDGNNTLAGNLRIGSVGTPRALLDLDPGADGEFVELDYGGLANLSWYVGTGSPEGAVTAEPGSTYWRYDDGTGALWAKQSGTGNTGWVDMTTGGGVSIGGTVTGGTDNAILFVNPAGVLDEDPGNFEYDETNNVMSVGAAVDSDKGLNLVKGFTGAAASTQSGLYVNSTIDTASANALDAVEVVTGGTHTSGTQSEIVGLDILNRINGVGGTTTDVIGARIDLVQANGTITNGRQLHLPAPTGTFGTSWGITQRSEAVRNYFAGLTAIGFGNVETQASTHLDVQGNESTTNVTRVANVADDTSNYVSKWVGNTRETALENDEAYMSFFLDNDGSNETEFNRLVWYADAVTEGGEDGGWKFGTALKGVMAYPLIIDFENGAWFDQAQDGYAFTISSASHSQMMYVNSVSDYLTFGSVTQINGALVGIDGQSNQTQFAIQENATQTAQTFVLETSAGTDYLTASNTSGIRINSNATSTALLVSGDTVAGLIQTQPASDRVIIAPTAELRIPYSAAPTIAVDGDFAIDQTITDFSHGLLKYYDGEELAVISVPVAELTSPSDGDVVTYDATNDEFTLQPGGGSSHAYFIHDDTVAAESISSTSYTDIHVLLVDFSQLATSTGTMVLNCTIANRDLDARVTDDTGGTTTYGSSLAIAASGNVSFALTGLPTTGIGELHIQYKKASAGGTDPDVNSETLYHG